MTRKPSIDKPWLKYYTKEADKPPFAEVTAYQHLYECNKDYLDGIALEYYGVKISYAMLFEKIDMTAKAFAAQGVKSGDIVTVMMPNTPEVIYCFYALNKIGACSNMLSPLLTPRHITESISLTKTNVIIVLDKIFNMLDTVLEKTIAERIVIVSPLVSLPPVMKLLGSLKSNPPKTPRNGKYISWKKFIEAGKDIKEISQAAYKKDTPATIVYSSGSTGASKGSVLTNDSFTAFKKITQQFMEKNNARRGQSSLGMIPFCYSTGPNSSNHSLCFGITVILMPIYDEKSFCKHVIKDKPNYVLATTTFFEAMLKNRAYEKVDLSFLTQVLVAGETLHSNTKKEIDTFLKSHHAGTRIEKMWGMCEYGSGVTLYSPELENTKNENESVGIPLPHIIVSAFDPDTDEELSYNERGEIRVITPCRMLGYYKNPEATAAFFREGKDGQIWGCSGDMGYIDEDGNVFIEGRANDYIRGENGNKIWLFDIEKVILTDEAVQLCAAVGLTAGKGHIPTAHLVLKQDCTEKPEEVIRRVHERCVKSLLSEAVPRRYKIRGRFNVLPSGKRDTRSLKDERDGFYEVDGNEVREAEV